MHLSFDLYNLQGTFFHVTVLVQDFVESETNKLYYVEAISHVLIKIFTFSPNIINILDNNNMVVVVIIHIFCTLSSREIIHYHGSRLAVYIGIEATQLSGILLVFSVIAYPSLLCIIKNYPNQL